MPFQKITFRGGVNSQKTQLAQQGGWHDSNLIRFRESMPEVTGGWTAFLPEPVNGIPRGLHAWQTLLGISELGIGTNSYLYVSQVGNLYDLTPIVLTTTPTSPYTTVIGTSDVVVHDVASSRMSGDRVVISGGSAVAGLVIAGTYVISSSSDPDHYVISTAPDVASGSTTGGGTPTFNYLLPYGNVNAIESDGWGVGAWGLGTWGTPRTSGIGLVFPRLWTLDNWGENLVANPRGLGIYQWVPQAVVNTRAVTLTNAPTQCNAILVAAPLQMLIAFGCNPPVGGTQDPMLVAWTDEGDNTIWTPSTTNQAGSFRLSSGSLIMNGILTQQQVLIWTDTSLFGMQYIQPPLVWGFTQLGAGCGAISPEAMGALGSRVVWMANYEFWSYNGQVQPIDCPLWDQIFKNLNRQQQSKIICRVNTERYEATWHYPSLNSQENDKYATVNFNQEPPEWTGGDLARTAGIDDNVFGNPISAKPTGTQEVPTGVIYNDEQGYTDDGAAMPWFMESGFFDVSNGQDIMFVDLFLPDQILTGGSCTYTFKAKQFTGDDPDVYGPFTVTPTTKFISFRIRHRMLALRVENSGGVVGNFFRLGAGEFRVARNGRV